MSNMILNIQRAGSDKVTKPKTSILFLLKLVKHNIMQLKIKSFKQLKCTDQQFFISSHLNNQTKFMCNTL